MPSGADAALMDLRTPRSVKVAIPLGAFLLASGIVSVLGATLGWTPA
jgi:hypothetical protein